MKRIDVIRKKINKKDYVRRTAHLSDVTKHIKQDAIIYCEDRPILVYKKLKTPTTKVRSAVQKIKYTTGKRVHGLKSQSAVFGYKPRQENRADYCSATAMAKNSPNEHCIISEFAKEIQRDYKDYFPETFEYHTERVKEKIKKEWVIKDSVFTSGIVNKNNQLNYHFDSGNFKGVYSNMIVFKGDVKGGHLVIPEIDISIEVADNTVSIFDGQDLLHGVSPITYLHKDSYRYSIVYYSLQRMWQCMEVEEEIDRIRKVKMQREIKRNDPKHIEKLKQRKKEAKHYKNTIENEQK
tara:strand:+ start:1381 stop:2262 length:882 start_codon:yes stop_codon:yes gene_type:complete